MANIIDVGEVASSLVPGMFNLNLLVNGSNERPTNLDSCLWIWLGEASGGTVPLSNCTFIDCVNNISYYFSWNYKRVWEPTVTTYDSSSGEIAFSVGQNDASWIAINFTTRKINWTYRFNASTEEQSFYRTILK